MYDDAINTMKGQIVCAISTAPSTHVNITVEHVDNQTKSEPCRNRRDG